MALNAAGYTAAGAGTAAANGNYVPATGASATLNGATQYTNGTYTLNYSPTGPNGPMWEVASSGSLVYYVATGSTPTNMPLTGWGSPGGPGPFPTFTAISGSAPASAPRLQPRVIIF